MRASCLCAVIASSCMFMCAVLVRACFMNVHCVVGACACYSHTLISILVRHVVECKPERKCRAAGFACRCCRRHKRLPPACGALALALGIRDVARTMQPGTLAIAESCVAVVTVILLPRGIIIEVDVAVEAVCHRRIKRSSRLVRFRRRRCYLCRPCLYRP